MERTISSSCQQDAPRFEALAPTPFGWSLNLPVSGLAADYPLLDFPAIRGVYLAYHYTKAQMFHAEFKLIFRANWML